MSRKLKFLSGITDSFSPFDESTGEFLPLDLNTAKEQLNLLDQAVEDGLNDVPHVSKQSKEAFAHEIDSYLKKIISMGKDKLEDKFTAIDDLYEFQPESHLHLMKELFNDGLNSLKTTARNYYNDLFIERRDWVDSEAEYSLFKERLGDKLKRIGPPSYPDDRIKESGLIFLIALPEFAMNSYALSDAHPNGFFGVVVEIFMFCLINIGLAFILGYYVWRWFNHISLAVKLRAYIISPILIGSLIFLNFVLAHYRDAIAGLFKEDISEIEQLGNLQQLFAKAMETLFSPTFYMFDDIKSFLLLCVGLLVAFVTVVKAYGLDDPYPGYGKLHRKQDSRAKSFNQKQTKYLDDLNDLVYDFTTQINGVLAGYSGGDKEVDKHNSEREKYLRKYNDWLGGIEKDGQALYESYRQENLKNRTDNNTEPACFKLPYTLPSDAHMDFTPAKKAANQYKILERESNKFNDTLNQLNEKFQKKFKDIEKLSPDELKDSSKTPSEFLD